MDDARYSFVSDVKERKNIARSARNKKCGSKTKYVGLPHDKMTRKQWEKKNTDIYTFNMSKPSTWLEFKSVPKDIQVEYINNLIEKYGVTTGAIARMMGVSGQTVRNYFSSIGEDSIISTHRRMTREQQNGFDSFLSGVVDNKEKCYNTDSNIESNNIEVEIPEVAEVAIASKENIISECDKDTVESNTCNTNTEDTCGMYLTTKNISMSFECNINDDSCLEIMTRMISMTRADSDMKYRVSISMECID